LEEGEEEYDNDQTNFKLSFKMGKGGYGEVGIYRD
jgi:hypothetical protein